MVLVFFTLFVWTLIAFATFAARAGGGLVWIFISIGTFTSGYAIMLLPGILVLATPVHGRTLFDLSDDRFSLNPITIISITAQVAVAGVFFVGMMRRYRGQTGPALPVGLGLALVAAWVVLSVGGIGNSLD
jgi:hypothetical protein